MRTSIRTQSGFSIVETMIAIMLGLVILAALTTFFVNTSQNRREIERTSRQIENGRFAIDQLATEIRLAGFYAELSQAGATYTTPDPCEALNPGNMGLALAGLKIPSAVFGYGADTVVPACVSNRVPNTDVLVLHRLNTTSVATTAAANDQLYVQTSRCATDSTATPWVFDYGLTGTLSLKNTTCSGPDNVYQFHVEILYIRSYSDVVGDGIPTLVRLDLDKKTIRQSPLVEGIQLMRLSYGIDNDGDGAPDAYSRCDTASPCTAAQWGNVTTVKVSLLSQNLEDSPDYTDGKTYTLDGYSPAVFSDHRKRHVYTSLVSMPNRTGPREN